MSPHGDRERRGLRMTMRTALDAEQGLARSLVFGVLSKARRQRLAANGQVVTLLPGALLCQKGDPGDAAYLVMEGELEVRTVSPDGRLVRLAALGRGEIAGEMAVLDGAERSADMVAARNTRLLKVARGALIEALVAEPLAAIGLIEALTGRLRATDLALEALHTLDLGGRLANLLIAEAGMQGLVSLTQGEMAHRIGASREKVNRQLGRWRADGLVSVSKAGVRLLSPDRLEVLAGHNARPSAAL
jgi:CRP/FNR family transcriptional regulator, cyclic AMP receptor protein